MNDIMQKKMKKLHPNEKVVFLFVDNASNFPVRVKEISDVCNIHKCNLSHIITKLANLDMIDIIDMGTHLEIFKKGYL